MELRRPRIAWLETSMVEVGERGCTARGLAVVDGEDLVGARRIRAGVEWLARPRIATRLCERIGGRVREEAAGLPPISFRRRDEFVVSERVERHGIAEVVLDDGVVPVEERDRPSVRIV